MIAATSIKLGLIDIAVAGGMERYKLLNIETSRHFSNSIHSFDSLNRIVSFILYIHLIHFRFRSMSNCPYYLPKVRQGLRMGDGKVVDGMIKDGLWDAYGNYHMGVCAEFCSEKYKITREQQVKSKNTERNTENEKMRERERQRTKFAC
jgi:acetyl-CoA acetyltransferase